MALKTCSICGFTTHKPSTFSMHVSMKHKTRTPHKCVDCGKEFKVKTQLQHHRINYHSRVKQPCLYHGCKCQFKTLTSHKVHYMRKHMKSHEMFYPNGDNTVACSTCHQTFTNKAIFYHLASCYPQSPFINYKPLLFMDDEFPEECGVIIHTPQNELEQCTVADNQSILSNINSNLTSEPENNHSIVNTISTHPTIEYYSDLDVFDHCEWDDIDNELHDLLGRVCNDIPSESQSWC